ncbi:MAG: hypothetical protein H6834_16100, partial [Planctomycetes bacterium]|nr:hypothetical protein [Planctomycetota bacterium]
DEETKTISFTGTATGFDGKPTKTEHTLSYTTGGNRTYVMKMPEMKSTMTIKYSRRAAK